MAVEVVFLPGNSTNNIDTNFQRVKDALMEVVGRNGDLPNQMEADFDLNSNDVLNGGLAQFERIILDGVELDTVGPQGWSPVYSSEEYNGTIIFKLIDYVGGGGTKPTDYIGQYISDNGYTTDPSEATNFGSTGVTDGDKGDVVVSGGGSVWTVPDLATIADGDKGDITVNGTSWSLNRSKQTIALAQTDTPAIDPDYYDIAYYDNNRAIESGGKYKKVVSEPSHTGKFQNGNGTWYELNEPVITPQMLGYVTGNVSPFINAAFSVGSIVSLPPFNNYTATTSFSKTMTNDFELRGNKALVLFNHQITWEFKGTLVKSGVLPQSSRNRYQTTAIMDASGVLAGDIFYINNPNQAPLSGWGDTKKDCILINSVVLNSGEDTVNLAAGYNFNWTLSAADNFIDIWRPVRASFIDINFRINNPVDSQAHYMLHLVGLRDIKIVRPRLTAPIAGFDRVTQFHRIGIQIWKCWNWSITDAYYEGLAYPIGVYGGTRNGFETNTTAYYCRHGHADLGDFSSDYHLIGLHTDSCYAGLSTHPCFRAYATNFTCTNDVDIINWRCIGGGIANGVAHDLSNDSGQSPQFHSEAFNTGFNYIYEDADFFAMNVNFNNKLRTATNPPFRVTYGRHVHIENITAPAMSAFTSWTLIQLLSVGNGVVSMTGTAFRGPGKYAAGVVQP